MTVISSPSIFTLFFASLLVGQLRGKTYDEVVNCEFDDMAGRCHEKCKVNVTMEHMDTFKSCHVNTIFPAIDKMMKECFSRHGLEIKADTNCWQEQKGSDKHALRKARQVDDVRKTRIMYHTYNDCVVTCSADQKDVCESGCDAELTEEQQVVVEKCSSGTADKQNFMDFVNLAFSMLHCVDYNV